MNGEIISRMPATEYFALQECSITRLKAMLRSPQHYLHELGTPKESKPLSLGRAAHVNVLEPERMKEFAVWRRRTKAGDMAPRNSQWWEQFLADHPGMDVITEDEEIYAAAIAKAVHSYAPAMRYFQIGEPEVVMRWQMHGRKCKGRMDWFTRVDGVPTIVGLKTTVDCRGIPAGNSAWRFGYHLQWAWYEDGYKVITEEQARIVEIFVEAKPPHAVAVYPIPEEIREQGRQEYEQCLETLALCEQNAHWPGPQQTEEPLTLPTRAYPQADDISELGLEA